MTSLDKIDHIVVLMLENRSFDNMLGGLYPASANFNGLTGNETNSDSHGNQIKVWNNGSNTSPATMTIPDPEISTRRSTARRMCRHRRRSSYRR